MLGREADEQKASDLFMRCFPKIHNESKTFYQLDLLKWLGSYTLVIVDDKGIFFKQKDYIESDKLISTHVQKNHIEIRKYEGRGDITGVCNKVLKSIISEFESLISGNPIGYLICLLTYLEQNVLGTIASITWLHDKFRNGLDTKNDNYEFSVVISQTFARLLEENKDSFNYIFKNWEAYLGLDKSSLEMAIEIVADNIGLVENSYDEVDMEAVLEYARAIGNLLKMRDDANNEIFTVQSITINEEGYINLDRVNGFEEKYLEFQNRNLQWLINKEANRETPIDLLKQIDQISVKFLGLNTKEIEDMATGLLNYFDSNTWLISNQKNLPRKILEYFNHDQNVIEQFLSLLIRKPIPKNDYTIVSSRRDSRPLRKSLIIYYKDWFISPSSILFYSLIGLISDILDGNLEDEDFSRELENVYKLIDNEFVKKIANELTKTFGGKVTLNIDKVDIGRGKLIVFPGEIDILYFINKTVFVVECKNFPFKFNTQAIGNEIKRTKTKFSQKLGKKVLFVSENLELFASVFEEKVENISGVVGLIVTNNFSFTEVIDGMLFPVVNHTEMVNWFEGYFND